MEGGLRDNTQKNAIKITKENYNGSQVNIFYITVDSNQIDTRFKFTFRMNAKFKFVTRKKSETTVFFKTPSEIIPLIFFI